MVTTPILPQSISGKRLISSLSPVNAVNMVKHCQVHEFYPCIPPRSFSEVGCFDVTQGDLKWMCPYVCVCVCVCVCPGSDLGKTLMDFNNLGLVG